MIAAEFQERVRCNDRAIRTDKNEILALTVSLRALTSTFTVTALDPSIGCFRVFQNVRAYAVAPQAEINHANLALMNPAIRQRWTEHSNVTRDLIVPHADALCPSLSAYYADTIGSGDQIRYWKNFAIETIKESRRIAPDKPVYPFIWPQFHQGGGEL